MPSKSKSEKNTVFIKQYGGLNVAQKKAVDTIEGPVIVIAGPGTGKTTILTLRIANILQKTQIPADAILALTFTESGAYAMRRKLAEIIGGAAYRVNISTFHSFADSVINEYPDYFPRIIGSTVITPSEQIKIIEKIIKSDKKIKVLKPYGDPGYYVRPVLKEIQALKRENVAVQNIKLDKKDEREHAKNSELIRVYKRYEEQLAKQKFYDFDDMLLELIKALEDNRDLKLILQEKYQYVLADEHQDANAAQNRILELLSDFHDSPNLFIVGDDKQAIYRFQGASLDNFLYFSKKYKTAKVIELEHNYRSHQAILDASHSLIKANPSVTKYGPKRLLSLRVGSKPINITEYSNTKTELAEVAKQVKQLIALGENPDEISVLFRDNRESKAISESLMHEKIPYKIESDYNVLGTVEAVKIIMLSKAAYDLSNSEWLSQALFLPEMNCESAAVAELARKSQRENMPLYKLVKTNPEIFLAYKKLESWSKLGQTLSYPDLLQRIISETGFLKSVMKESDSLIRLGNLEAFFDKINDAALSKKTFFLKDFIEFIEVLNDYEVMEKRKFTEHVNGVRLMTAHRAKGQEFNHVFIVNVIDGLWGNRRDRNHFNLVVDKGHNKIEDERRLFYVALTRARESVFVSFAKSNSQKETLPSQFLSEIDSRQINLAKSNSLGTDFIEKTDIVTPTNSILDLKFIKSKLYGQSFAVTHLNNYLDCPWRYFFVNLIRVPQAQSKSQMYGTAIHNALRTFFDSYKNYRDLSAKQLIDLFRHNINKQPMSVTDKNDSIKKGSKALTGYYKSYNKTWSRNLLTEYVVKGAMVDRLELTGKLDKLEFADSKSVIVTDFKTAKPKSRNEIEGKTKDSLGNYKRQLVFYNLLLNKVGKLKMKYAEIDFIEPNERGLYKKERFVIEENEIADLQESIRAVINEIETGTFFNKQCNDKHCVYCQLGKILVSRTD